MIRKCTRSLGTPWTNSPFDCSPSGLISESRSAPPPRRQTITRQLRQKLRKKRKNSSSTIRKPPHCTKRPPIVIATQTETGVGRTTPTHETGSYVLSILAVGPYRLEATLKGLRTSAQGGSVLQVNASRLSNVVLQVGQEAEQVELRADAALVED